MSGYKNSITDINGNVGIGTSIPTSALEVSQQLSAQSTVDYPLTLSSRDDNNSINQLGGEGIGIRFRLAGNENTNPGDSLIGASIAAIRENYSDTVSSTALVFFTSQNDSTLDPAMRITSAGNVGIGTSSPDANLEISSTNPEIYLTDTSASPDGGVVKLSNVNTDFIINVDPDNIANSSTIQFELDGTERMRLNANGFGIGAVSPQDLLHVYSDSTDANLMIQSVNTNGDARLKLIANSGGFSQIRFEDEADANVGLLTYEHSDNSMQFRVNDAERMRIASNGNVGIGTSSPVAKLEINGDSITNGVIYATNPMGVAGSFSASQISLNTSDSVDTTGWQGISFDTSTAAAYGWSIGANRSGDGRGSFRFYEHIGTNDGIERFTLQEDGNVGIGTSSPASTLDVNGVIKGRNSIRVDGEATDSPYFGLYQNGVEKAYMQYVDSGDIFKVQSDGIITLTTGLNERMRIDSSGNVGINISSPQAKFHAKSSGDGSYVIRGMSSAATDLGGLFQSTTGDGEIYLKTSAVVTNVRISSNNVTYFNGGNVGIGTTSPSAPIHVQRADDGDIGIFRGTSNAQLLLGIDGGNLSYDASNGSATHVFKTDSTERMRITSTGYVGIGTSSPSRDLHINSTDPTLVLTHSGGVNNSNSGRILFGEGPIYSDLNTSHFEIIYNGATNYLSFNSPIDNNDGLLTIGRSGYVGIGTATPSQKLDVDGNIVLPQGNYFSIRRSGLDNPILWQGDGIFGSADQLYLRQPNNNSLNFQTNSSTKMTITGGGNVGIGTTTPSTKLDIVSEGAAIGDTGYFYNARFKDSSNVGVLIGHNNISNGNGMIAGINKLAFLTYGTEWGERMNIDGAGNVGIGVTDPFRKLQVDGEAGFVEGVYVNSLDPLVGATTTTQLMLQAKGNQSGFIRNSLWYLQPVPDSIYGNSGLSIKKGYDGGSAVEFMRINSAGNVGIGTSSPAVKLEIGSVMSTSPTSNIFLSVSGDNALGGGGSLIFSSSASAGTNELYNAKISGVRSSSGDGSSDLLFATTYASTSTSPITRLTIKDTGNVGIGTSSPSQLLTLVASNNFPFIHWNNTSGTNMAFAGYHVSGGDFRIGTAPSLPLVFQTNTTERMRIDSAGNVGIGTSSPKSNLHVAKPGNRNGGSLLIGENGSGTGKWSFLAGAHYNQDTGSGNGSGSAGIAIAGSYSFSDQNRVIIGGGPYEINAATEISFYTHTSTLSTLGGTERMRIHSDGNVSIGTTANSVKLLVFGNGNAQDTVSRLQNGSYNSSDSSGECKFELGFSNHIAAGISAYKQTTNTTGLKFYIEYGYNVPVEGMRLDVNKNLHVDGDVIAYSTTVSDERLKDNITTIDNALDKVCELRGVEYDWNASSRAGQHDMGVIAQEVEKVFPFIVREKEMPLVDGNTYKTVDYEKLVGVLIEAVKELKTEIEILKAK